MSFDGWVGVPDEFPAEDAPWIGPAGDDDLCVVCDAKRHDVTSWSGRFVRVIVEHEDGCPLSFNQPIDDGYRRAFGRICAELADECGMPRRFFGEPWFMPDRNPFPRFRLFRLTRARQQVHERR